MRRLLALLPFMALLGACAETPRQFNPNVAQQGSEMRQCLSQLAAARARYMALPDRQFSAGCSARGTVRLANLSSDQGMLSLTNLGPVTCPLANTFAAWARYGVGRAAQQILGSELERIETMGSYSCRTIAGTQRLSAHATASAIDVSAFILADGRRITVQGDWTQGTPAERQFLRVIHASACKRFGTVLGPAYNAAHADHLHVELGGDGYCR